MLQCEVNHLIAMQAEDVKPSMAEPDPQPAAGKVPLRGVGKDPTVPTDFLPDRERERQEEDLRHQLKTEFQLRQQVGPTSGNGKCPTSLLDMKPAGLLQYRCRHVRQHLATARPLNLPGRPYWWCLGHRITLLLHYLSPSQTTHAASGCT